MDLDELKLAVAAVDSAAVLVAPRILRRVLQAEFKVPYLLMRVPHERCYVFERQVLFRHVEQDELDLEPDFLLPPTVILLARPTAEQIQAQGREVILSRYWRLLFHAHIHLALQARQQEGHLAPADIRARVEQIGSTEFGEIRTVLHQESELLPPASDLNVYIEFVANYLELRYFRKNLLGTYFPAIRDSKAIDLLLARDVDSDAVFARMRLPGAPDPIFRTDTSSDESHDYYWRLLRNADQAGKEGDRVRAAVLRTRAARVAPPALAQNTLSAATGDLKTLTQHLQNALKFGPEEAAEWLTVLPSLLDKADQGQWPVEAKLLYDLQKISHETERKLYALDLVEWATSAGKRPIKRPLNGLQIVRPVNHLRSAAQRLTMVRVSDEDRQHLSRLLQAAEHKSEERLRERFRPILNDAFHDVGLVPDNPPEQVALEKMIEELLDRITENGFFSFSDLRDTISSNQLKLPDLSDPNVYWRGDPLLLLDRRLATPMEGVYQPAEFYLRWMESCSSLFFGTMVGRFLTLNLLVPFGGAFLLLRGVAFLWNHSTNQEVDVPWYAFIPFGSFLLCLTHIEELRRFFSESGASTLKLLRLVFYETPSWIWRQPRLQQMLGSWPFLLLFWYVLKPLAVCVLLVFFWPEVFGPWAVRAGAFLGANLLLNSRYGTAAGEAVQEALTLLYAFLRFDALRGLFRLVQHFFKKSTETVEYVLYSVDEWLRFRSDEGRVTMVLRGILGVLWFPVRYLVRIYFVMLIEPSLNPLKLPISILAAKFFVIIPKYVLLLSPGSEVQREFINDSLAPRTGWLLAVLITYLIVVPTLWLLPSAVAFLIWEMKGNWRLFRSNRSARLRPIVVGHHGEHVLQLLKPGVHSGTIPKLYGYLRRAERGAYRTNNWRAARTYRQAVSEVSRSVKVFVEREFVALLHQSKWWVNQPVKVAQVLLSCNLIRVELAHADFPQETVWLTLEERAGWILGGLREAGWLRQLNAEQRRVWSSALAGLYKLAGVDFIREQLAAVLPPPPSGYDLTDHQLLVWSEPNNGQTVAFDLRESEEPMRPHLLNGEDAVILGPLASRQVFFSRLPITWEQWVTCWKEERKGVEPPQLFGDSVHLLPKL